MSKNNSLLILVGFLIGTLIRVSPSSNVAEAQGWISWSKDQVIPVVLVKPSIGGFAPIEGSSIGNYWSKDEVVPMCPVKPTIGGFAPTQGSPIGNTWSRADVKPFILVKPAFGAFVPFNEE